MRILFAEDDRTLARGVTALLEHDGYIVNTVGDGLSAVHYAQQEHYDCIMKMTLVCCVGWRGRRTNWKPCVR